MLIARITSLANFFSPFLRLFIVLTIASFGYISYLLVFADVEVQQQVLQSTLLWFLWLFLASLMIYSFSGQPLERPEEGWWRKFKYKLSRFFCYVMLCVFMLLTIATLYFTYKIIII